MKGNFPSVLIIIKKVKTLSIEVQNLIKNTYNEIYTIYFNFCRAKNIPFFL